MKNKLAIMSMAFLVLLAPLAAKAATFPHKPPAAHFYVDEAGLIDQKTGERIDSMAAAMLNEGQVPLYVVTIPSLASHGALTMSIEQYAKSLFDHWGIGTKAQNFGMLLLIARGDRKARIELGAGWGRNYDYQARMVMNELIIPAFKRGDYATGIGDGVRGMNAMARGLEQPAPTLPWWYWPVRLGIVLLLVGLIVNLFKTGRTGWAWALIAALGVVLFFIIKALLAGAAAGGGGGSFGGGGGGFGGGGGSGGGFGGGFSGGGGATGSW